MQLLSCAAGDGGWSGQGRFHQGKRQFSLGTPTPLIGPPMTLAGLTKIVSSHQCMSTLHSEKCMSTSKTYTCTSTTQTDKCRSTADLLTTTQRTLPTTTLLFLFSITKFVKVFSYFFLSAKIFNKFYPCYVDCNHRQLRTR
ncbi:unnamed protein product [Aphis gossypii]|uniref:Uncharacterized protein n=1 Tax=Aphis gossypii TaxID=80765 RepID=A0A9P0IK61_APHGO|nr:unnamed protein product [Aphis gossypii]